MKPNGFVWCLGWSIGSWWSTAGGWWYKSHWTHSRTV